MQHIYIENIKEEDDGSYSFDIVSSVKDDRTDFVYRGRATINVDDIFGKIESCNFEEIFGSIAINETTGQAY